VLFDNDRGLVSRYDRETREVGFNARFKAFACYWGFRPRACAPYRARTKGKDERGRSKIFNASAILDASDITLFSIKRRPRSSITQTLVIVFVPWTTNIEMGARTNWGDVLPPPDEPQPQAPGLPGLGIEVLQFACPNGEFALEMLSTFSRISHKG
jgi:hypothetical protein